MRSFHSTTAWSTCTGLLLVWPSTPSAFTTTWKPAGIHWRPRVTSVARMAVMTTCCAPLRCVSPGSWGCSGWLGSSPKAGRVSSSGSGTESVAKENSRVMTK
ncbi:hypothetical protein EDB19DRAFT_1796788 [Suillus lakei]|nr:hypothetical protein EDB19DRAFT_1796788 [Suillus lakei]